MTHTPNIVFIVLDTQRRDRLSHYNPTVETSPNFDAFARQAVTFERAVAPSHWTLPSHASFFTGTYPSQHGFTQSFDKLSGALATLPEILATEGYRTVGFCNNPLLGLLDNNLRRGFMEFYNYPGVASNRPIYHPTNAIMQKLNNAYRAFASQVVSLFSRNRLFLEGGLFPPTVPLWTRLLKFKGDTELSINDMVRYWEHHDQTNRDEPLFLFLNLMGVHTPYHPEKRYLDDIKTGIADDAASQQFIRHFNTHPLDWHMPSADALETWQKTALDSYYMAEVKQQDAHLGRLLDYIRNRPDADDTLVILLADHGEGHGDHGYHGHSFSVHQELVHVPLVMHYPRAFPQGRHIESNVSLRRLYHTLLDITGITPPLASDDPNYHVADYSLENEIQQRTSAEHDRAYTEAFPPHLWLSAIRDRNPDVVTQHRLSDVRRGLYVGDYKLMLVDNDVEALYHVASDDRECDNLVESQPRQVAALQRVIQDYIDGEGQPDSIAPNTPVDDKVLDQLRALGYMD